LVAWLVLGENLAPAQIAGGALVVVAILIAQSLRPTADSV
jgi:drug/metabolite transporter (DMT)-like permease